MKTENAPYLIGITGGSASGKTHFLNSLKNLFGADEVCIISQDNYYKRAYQHQKDENGHINFDLPECIDLHLFATDIAKLKKGRSVEIEEYLFQHTDVQPQKLVFKPAKIIVCEGLFIFYQQEILEQFDLKIFINADEEIAFNRRLKRDVAERNIDEDFVLYQWKNHVIPSYRKYLLPFMAQADLIVNNNVHFEQSLKVVSDHLRSVLNQH
jgi:uridine kinase